MLRIRLRALPLLLSAAVVLVSGAEAHRLAFNAPIAYPIGLPGPLAVADFNGDGIPDLAIQSDGFNFSQSVVSIMFGKGDGTFKPSADYPVGEFPDNMMTGDFNGDGKPDLVLGCANEVVVLLNNGDGTFSPMVTSSNAPSGPVAVADFNGDGKLDVALLGDSILVFLGNGDGTLQAPVSYSSGSNAGAILAVDFNGDGKPDLAVSQNAPGSGGAPGGIAILLGNGDGTFQPMTVFATGLQPQSMVLGDYNGDGHADLALTDDEGSVSIMLGKGDGTFPSPLVSQFLVTDDYGEIITADFNRDGKADLALNGDLGFSVLLGNGDGTFQAPHSYFGAPGLLLAADLNGDGDPDLVVSDGDSISDTNTVSIVLNDRSGGFVNMPNYSPTTNSVAVTVADFNNDGEADVAVAGINSEVDILLGNGDGTLRAASFNHSPGPAVSLAVGDFNHDGKPDLAVGIAKGVKTAQAVLILLGKGNGTFTTGAAYGTAAIPSSIAAGDFNGDGKLDLATVGETKSNGAVLSVLLGKGDGTFEPPVTYAIKHGTTIVAADFNGDHKLDLAIGAYYSRTVTVLIGKGDGTFESAVEYSAPGSGALTAGDFNKDGVMDLATVSGDRDVDNAAVLSILLGKGNGTFKPAVNYRNVGRSPRALATVDINGDGNPDLAISDSALDTAGFMLGDGKGAFQAPLYFNAGVPRSPATFAVADFNGDGKPDLALAGFSSLTLLLNTTR